MPSLREIDRRIARRGSLRRGGTDLGRETTQSTGSDGDGDIGEPSWRDGGTSAWLTSMLVHLVLLVIVGLVGFFPPSADLTLLLVAPLDSEPLLEIPLDIQANPLAAEQIGSESRTSLEAALSRAPKLADHSQIPTPELDVTDVGKVELDLTIDEAVGMHLDMDLPVRGAVGVATVGASGAVDRITQEILRSLEQRDTLVVWLFDQSGSLQPQRKEIHQRIDRIYEELGVLTSDESDRDQPLLTSVVAFGRNVSMVTKRPTDNIELIKNAIAQIPSDTSGIESVFTAIYKTVRKYQPLRRRNPDTHEPTRNVMLVVFTDEAGNDQHGLDKTAELCRRLAIPVYVVGVPAPFGRVETRVKWVDPDPKFDQSPQWLTVNQGPESARPERLRLHFASRRIDQDAIDSGFGSYALTRLCYESGGIYFAVHPNRRTDRPVGRRETAPMSVHMKYFFDPDVMWKYRPDYLSSREYMKRVQGSVVRKALVQAAELSWVAPMAEPRLLFVKRNEATLATEVSEAQKGAAKLEPQINRIYEILRQGESGRDDEDSLRWQAGYDLAMGRALAVKARTSAYNAMLAKAKRGMKFKGEKNNTWHLRPHRDLSELGSQLKKLADQAEVYLKRVVENHPETPWALLAHNELQQPLGWRWDESYTNLDPPRNNGGGGGGGNPAPGNDEKAKKIKRKPRRKPPQL